MREALKPLLQALRFERSAFSWMDFNDRASGDALVFVIVTRFLMYLGFGGTLFRTLTSLGALESLFFSLVNALVFWLAYAGLVLVVAKYLFQGSGTYAFYLRATGFAYPTMLATVVTFRLDLPVLLALLLGAVWFMLIVTRAVQYESELPVERAAATAGLAMVGWILVALILKHGLI